MANFFTGIYPLSHGVACSDYGIQEANDCAVRALANAARIDYTEAHTYLKNRGRNNKRPVNFECYHHAFKDAGMDLEGVYGTTLDAKYVSRVANRPARKGMTLKTAMEVFGWGSYIFIVSGHAMAVIDGELIDDSVQSGAQSITHIYQSYSNLSDSRHSKPV